MTHIAVMVVARRAQAVFGALLCKHDEAVVHWIAGRSTTGRGVAYATDDDHHLLNVRASGMGLYADQDEDFVPACFARSRERTRTDFFAAAPFRRLHRSSGSQAHKLGGTKRAVALPCTRWKRCASIHRSTDNDIFSRRRNLSACRRRCAGSRCTIPRATLRTVSASALASGAYELDPWNLSQRTRAPRRLIVIGTGLTAVDTLLSASTRLPDAELVAVSRHGQLPFVHPVLPIQPFPAQASLNASLLDCDGAAPMLRKNRSALRDAPDIDWRSLIDGMRPINATLWQNLTHAKRRQFLHHARWIWEASRHRVAPRSAETIQQLRDEGRLAGECRTRARRGWPGSARCYGSLALESGVDDASRQIWSCRPPDWIPRWLSPNNTLLSQLMDDGLVVADPLQLGLSACPDGRLLNARGDVQRGLYAIGSLLSRQSLGMYGDAGNTNGRTHTLASTLIADRSQAEATATVVA